MQPFLMLYLDIRALYHVSRLQPSRGRCKIRRRVPGKARNHMQTMNQSRPWKYMLAGTLAGASGAIGLMIAVTLGLGIGLIWQYAYFRNIVVLNDRATTTML